MIPRPTALLAALLLSSGCQESTATGLTIPHPDDASKQVEYVVRAHQGIGPWPTVVFLHGHQDGDRPGGEVFVHWGVLDAFAERGYLAVAVSQPGYGCSDGPADFSGPFTQHAVSGVIVKLRAERLARRTGCSCWVSAGGRSRPVSSQLETPLLRDWC